MQERVLNEWIEKGVRIRDPRTTVIDAGVEIGHDTVILPHTVVEEKSVIGKNCVIGPFARIRGASRVGDHCVVGNFVELVRSKIGNKTQIKHLSYIGDAEIGSMVNIGAGTITANYDGKKKHKTIIRDKAQIGSGTVLVAPVTVGRGAKTGAGAVVTRGKNVPDHAVVAGVPAREMKNLK
jgi:bifunctional UDP-N-acetylglucosamine pyrophosphorylase/glucosamine-1-phosphate N-acetyltransferase